MTWLIWFALGGIFIVLLAGMVDAAFKEGIRRGRAEMRMEMMTGKDVKDK